MFPKLLRSRVAIGYNQSRPACKPVRYRSADFRRVRTHAATFAVQRIHGGHLIFVQP